MMRGGYAAAQRARKLRATATDAERYLWAGLRGAQLGHRFRRQHPIPPYTVEFAGIAARLIIEVDGSQHGGPTDIVRDGFLRRRGWQVLRFWNNEVLENREGALEAIFAALPPPSRLRGPLPPPQAGEG
jgi:primosomal protein N' (replication factor Y)